MHFTFTTHIDCPPRDVFRWIDDPDRAMRWQKGVKSSEITRETPERIGTTFTETMEEDGRALEMTGMVTAYTAGESISFRLESQIHRVEVCYAVAGSERASIVSVETDIRWKFPMSVMSLFMGRQIREGIVQQTNAELGELKRLCETEQV